MEDNRVKDDDTDTMEKYYDEAAFLKELIKFAENGLDRLRLESSKNVTEVYSQLELGIEILTEEHKNTLTITDNGIGLTKTELVNLGTQSISGTKNLMEAASVPNSEIGQSDLSFCTAYLVSEKIIVTSKHEDDEQYVLESNAESFTISKDTSGKSIGRGTKVVVFLKDQHTELLQEHILEALIQKQCDLIDYPISLVTPQVPEGLKLDQVDSGRRNEAQNPRDSRIAGYMSLQMNPGRSRDSRDKSQKIKEKICLKCGVKYSSSSYKTHTAHCGDL